MTYSPRYALFSGRKHHPRGGALDFVGWFPTIEAAKTAFLSHRHDWADITDEDLNRLYEWYVQDYLYDDGEWVKVNS